MLAYAPVVMGCDSSDVDATTGACAHPYWVSQSYLLPELSAAAGIAIGVSIVAVWAVAYMYRRLRAAG